MNWKTPHFKHVESCSILQETGMVKLKYTKIMNKKSFISDAILRISIKSGIRCLVVLGTNTINWEGSMNLMKSIVFVALVHSTAELTRMQLPQKNTNEEELNTCSPLSRDACLKNPCYPRMQLPQKTLMKESLIRVCRFHVMLAWITLVNPRMHTYTSAKNCDSSAALVAAGKQTH